jgi:anaerobic selenocysteine-containing dehydrogenase
MRSVADTFVRKGNAILDLENDPDRVRTPLRKVDGGWREASWDEAFAEIGQRLHAIQAAHGRDAVAVYLGNPNVHHFSLMAYVPQLLRAIGSRNQFSASSVDQWPHQLVNWQMYGHQWLLPIPDLDRLDVLLMLGANPVASNGSLMTAPDVAMRLKAIRDRGALIVVDPAPQRNRGDRERTSGDPARQRRLVPDRAAAGLDADRPAATRCLCRQAQRIRRRDGARAGRARR